MNHFLRKRKKNFLKCSLLLLLLITATAHLTLAQNTSFVIGITRTKAKLASSGNDLPTDIRPGYYAGVISKISFLDNENSTKATPFLSLDPALMIYQKGYKREVATATPAYTINNEFNYGQINMPLLMNYGSRKFNVGIGGGGFVAYAINGKHTREYSDGSKDSSPLKFGYGDNHHFKSLDFGAMAKMELRFSFLTVQAEYHYSFYDINPKRFNGQVKNNGLAISAGLSF